MNENLQVDLINALSENAHYSKETAKQISDFREDIRVIESKNKVQHGSREIQRISLNDARMTILEYDSTFVGDINLATQIYHAQKMGMKLRQLKVDLKGGTVAFDSGQFLASSGNIEQGKTPLNPFEMVRGVMRKMNDETFFRPSLTGNGTVYLDSSLKFLTLLPVKTPTKVVMEKGIYLASIGRFEFKVTKNLNPGYMLLSEKSIFQTDARGEGVIALELPVHMDEIEVIDVTPDKPLMVNGNYVLLWSGSLKREVTMSGGVIGSLTSGTGLVEKYSGTGQVWLATTLGYYTQIVGSMQGQGIEKEKRTESIGSSDGKSEPSFFQKLFLGK